MDTASVPNVVRRLVVISSAFLVASLAITGFNAYTTFAAPPQAPFVPDTVGFEGQLADSSGNPVQDGTYDFTFKLYSLSTGGAALWTETQTDIQVTDGLYSVQLGSGTALSASDFDGDRWLGVTVGTDSEMAPLIPISAVPFALNARQAMGLQGRDVAAEPAPIDGQVLTWDTTSSEWIPGAPAIPSGAILLVPGDCPTPGYTEYTAARGRYVVGVPENGTDEATVGTALTDLEDRPVGEHSHDLPDHSHTYYNPGVYVGSGSFKIGSNDRGANTDTSVESLTTYNTGSVAGTNAPYIQLTLCQKD